MKTYPDTYLHVYDCKFGQEWIMEIKGEEILDLDKLITLWAEKEFGGELEMDGENMPNLDGDYYGKIMMDGRAPDSPICWTGGGFHLKSTYE